MISYLCVVRRPEAEKIGVSIRHFDTFGQLLEFCLCTDCLIAPYRVRIEDGKIIGYSRIRLSNVLASLIDPES